MTGKLGIESLKRDERVKILEKEMEELRRRIRELLAIIEGQKIFVDEAKGRLEEAESRIGKLLKRIEVLESEAEIRDREIRLLRNSKEELVEGLITVLKEGKDYSLPRPPSRVSAPLDCPKEHYSLRLLRSYIRISDTKLQLLQQQLDKIIHEEKSKVFIYHN